MKNDGIHYLGSYVCEFKVPLKIIDDLNNDIDDNLKQNNLFPWNNNLAGKIKHEFDILHILKEPILDCFKNACSAYINYGSKNQKFNINLGSCWFNDQGENEYNPAHTHHGKNLLEGLSAVMFLKIPEAIEKAKPVNVTEKAKDGRLEFVSSLNNMFANHTLLIHPKVGDLFIFPYGLVHMVYPFKGEGVRRSLSFNADLTLQN
jgi:hypothetical protein